MILDLTISTENPLYNNLGVTEFGGRFNLPNATSEEVLNQFGRAVHSAVLAYPTRDEVIMTGPAPIQLYLVAFHVVLHAFKSVRYRDGKGGDCLIAQHG